MCLVKNVYRQLFFPVLVIFLYHEFFYYYYVHGLLQNFDHVEVVSLFS